TAGSATQEQRFALTPTTAQPHRRTATAAALELVGRVEREARARGPDGVAERDRPAVDVDDVEAHAERACRVKRHGGEGLVDLDEVEVARLPSCAVER